MCSKEGTRDKENEGRLLKKDLCRCTNPINFFSTTYRGYVYTRYIEWTVTELSISDPEEAARYGVTVSRRDPRLVLLGA